VRGILKPSSRVKMPRTQGPITLSQAVVLPVPPNHGHDYINEHALIIKHPSMHVTSALSVSSPHAHLITKESAGLLHQDLACYTDATPAIQRWNGLIHAPPHARSQLQTSTESYFLCWKRLQGCQGFLVQSRGVRLLTCSVSTGNIHQ
jgi:hypothetical protein